MSRAHVLTPPTARETISRLATLMVAGDPVTVSGNVKGEHRSVTGLLNSIQREDGSGYCWNLSFSTKEGDVTMFYRIPFWFGK